MMRWIAEAIGSATALLMLNLWLVLPISVGWAMSKRNESRERQREEFIAKYVDAERRYDEMQRSRELRSKQEGRAFVVAGVLLVVGVVLSAIVVENAQYFARAFVATARAPID